MVDPIVTFRYESLRDVVKAYQTGELDRKTPLVISREGSSVTMEAGKKSDGSLLYEKVFDGGSPEALLEDALDLLRVPWTMGEP